MRLTEVNAEVGLPWGIGKVGGVWRPDDAEVRAAWELLVELSTRVSLVKVHDEGLLRESLNSLYSLFGVTRDILRRHGPSVANPSGTTGNVSFAFLAVVVLNGGIRPLLSYWHPTLESYEHTRPPQQSALDWEAAWERSPELRRDLNSVTDLLGDFAALIAEVCNARSLLLGATYDVPSPPGAGY